MTRQRTRKHPEMEVFVRTTVSVNFRYHDSGIAQSHGKCRETLEAPPPE
jgi:hypothetical protein